MFWNEKPYHSLDFEMKQQYGQKIYKLALDGGMTCPNRDGTLGHRGCIFCSGGGSGEFAESLSAHASITDQIEAAKEKVSGKIKAGSGRFIAYFQSYTNTYAPVSYLKELFTQAILHPDVAALSIATRPVFYIHIPAPETKAEALSPLLLVKNKLLLENKEDTWDKTDMH